MQHDDEVFEAIGNVKKDTEKLSYANHSDLNNHELDGIHDNLEFPTDEERATLRRVADTIPWNAYRESPHLFLLSFRSNNVFSHRCRGIG